MRVYVCVGWGLLGKVVRRSRIIGVESNSK